MSLIEVYTPQISRNIYTTAVTASGLFTKKKLIRIVTLTVGMKKANVIVMMSYM